MTTRRYPANHAELLRAYLEEACHELDQHRTVITPWQAFAQRAIGRRGSILPLAVGLSLGAVGCASGPVYATPEYPPGSTHGQPAARAGAGNASPMTPGQADIAGMTGGQQRYGIPVFPAAKAKGRGDAED